MTFLSLRLDAGLFDDASPFGQFAPDKVAESSGAHADDIGAFIGELLLRFGRILDGRDFLVQLVDDRLWRVGGRHDADSVGGGVALQARFADSWHILDQGIAFGRADTERPELAVAPMRDDRT